MQHLRQGAGDVTARRPPLVTLVGAGGLGGPLALALGAAGLELVVFDHDVVDATNLHRQLPFTLGDVGLGKAERLVQAVLRRGGAAAARAERWSPELAPACDLIVEGSDDPRTKFAVSDWAVARGCPAVIAGALGTGGNVLASAPGAACYRCLFEEPPAAAPSCAQAGVLGPVVAQVAALAARAALALARGDRRDAGSVWIFEGAPASLRHLRLAPRRDCAGCAAAAPGGPR